METKIERLFRIFKNQIYSQIDWLECELLNSQEIPHADTSGDKQSLSPDNCLQTKHPDSTVDTSFKNIEDDKTEDNIHDKIKKEKTK